VDSDALTGRATLSGDPSGCSACATMSVVRRSLRLRRSPVARALALVALLLGAGEGALAHHDGELHELRLGVQVHSASGCDQRHPASFEPVLGHPTVSCVGCLVHVQQPSGSQRVAALPAPAPRAERRLRPTSDHCPRGSHRSAASRGPPAA
jgi:hypothetical protein